MKKPLFFFILGWLFFVFGFIGLNVNDNQLFIKQSYSASTPDGILHYMDLYRPITDDASLKPGILFCHGVGVNKEFFHNYAVEFTKLGFICVTLEIRGHGNSGGYLSGIGLNTTEMRLSWPDVAALQYEVENAMSLLRNQTDIDVTKISAIGHSMGGGILLKTNVLHPDWFHSTVVLAPIPVWEINITTPRNLLLLHGSLDEAFSVENERSLFAQALGTSEFDYKTTYGNFSAGTARRMVLLPWDDHMSEFVDPFFMQESINWVELSNGISSENLPISSIFDLQIIIRISWMASGMIGIILFWISSALVFYSPKKTSPSNSEIQDRSELQNSTTIQTPRIILKEKRFKYALLMSEIFGCGLFLGSYITGAIITAAITGPLAGLGLGLLILYRNSLFEYKKLTWRKDILFSTIMGIVLYLTLIVFGNNFLNMVPNVPFSWYLLFFGYVSVGIIPQEFFIRRKIQEPWENQMICMHQEIHLKYRILLYLKVSLVQVVIFACATILPFGMEYFLIKNNFPWMFMGVSCVILFLFGFVNSIWYHYTKHVWINTIIMILPFTLILLAMTSRIMPFAFFA